MSTPVLEYVSVLVQKRFPEIFLEKEFFGCRVAELLCRPRRPLFHLVRRAAAAYMDNYLVGGPVAAGAGTGSRTDGRSQFCRELAGSSTVTTLLSVLMAN